MPIYRLRCVLRLIDGRAGAAFDNVDIVADGPEAAIALAKLYRCTTPGMALSVAVLTDTTGSAVWSLRQEEPAEPTPSPTDAWFGTHSA